MGKFTSRVPDKKIEKDLTKNLAWRGIGCALMAVIPAVSIAAASLTVSADWAQPLLPYQLMGYPILPPALFATNELAMVFGPIANIENLYAIVVISALYMIALGSFISLLYAFIYRAVNPRMYGPYDAPPPKVKAKKYKR